MRTRVSMNARALLAGCLLMATGLAQAATYKLAIPPFLPQAEMKAEYAKMADYLGKATGHTIELVVASSYLGFWEGARKGDGYDLTFDNAPMIDFRVQRQSFTVLAKVAGVVSQSLVTRGDVAILDAQELIGKPVATIASPNLSALVLFQMFSNPMRQPNFKYADNARDAVDMLTKGKVEAALIPTPIAILYDNLNVVTTSKQVPHLAIAAAPSVPTDVQAKIRQALVNASKTPEGQAMLKMLNTAGFESASNATYQGFSDLLKGTYGY